MERINIINISPPPLILSGLSMWWVRDQQTGVKTSCQSTEAIVFIIRISSSLKTRLFIELSPILIPTLRQKSLFALNIESKHASRTLKMPRYEICHSISPVHSFANYFNDLQFYFSPNSAVLFPVIRKGSLGVNFTVK